MKKLFILVALIGIAVGAQAQKYGHLNFGNLLALMPETAAAEAEMQAFRDQLNAEADTLAKAFQEKYLAAIEEVQSGTLSPLQQQQKQEELQKEQEKLAKYEQESSQKMQARRSELLEPIVTKAETAIQEVARENGYVMIFDTSVMNAVLFAQDADDVMPLVKAKLGIEDSEEGKE